MSINIAIFEDEPLMAIRLQELLTEINPSFRFVSPIRSVAKAVSFLKNNPKLDLLFMDIHLSDGSCFEIFEQVEVSAPVIFVTSYAQYAIKAFETHSIDYILKPISQENLSSAIDKFYNRQEWQQSNQEQFVNEFKTTQQLPSLKTRFLVKLGNTYQFIPINQVTAFFSKNGTSILLAPDGQKLPLEQSLDKIEIQIDPSQFFRINRKNLISITAIKKVHIYFNSRLKIELEKTHDTGDELDLIVSRERVQRFKEWLGN